MGPDSGTLSTLVYIGLGSNLQDPSRQVFSAFAALADLPSSRLVNCSRLYRSPPLGPPGQPDYVNAATLLDTGLGPLELLDALQAIERSRGRHRDGTRWGPRTLDLDLLLYGDQTMENKRLRLPHPDMHRRAFVLVPLADIAPPDLLIPGKGVLHELVEACDCSAVVSLG
jgi:2-amino-4-hydroxy-6-hydroxymethyldihydropteridine diphosphokinase